MVYIEDDVVIGWIYLEQSSKRLQLRVGQHLTGRDGIEGAGHGGGAGVHGGGVEGFDPGHGDLLQLHVALTLPLLGARPPRPRA